MELKIAEKLRRCRRERDMTQDQLAEAFGVSPQSISKWECGDGYPDITLLPMIANYFKISIDELLGNDEIAKDMDIRSVIDHIRESCEFDEGFRLLEELSRKYPDRYDILHEICASIRYQLNSEQREKYLSLLRKSCEKIIRESTEQTYRENAIECMCLTCPDDEFDKWYAMCAEEYSSYRGEVLEERLMDKNRFKEGQVRHDANNVYLIVHFLCREVRHWDTETMAEWNKFRIRFIEFLSDGGEIPPGWLCVYAVSHLWAASTLFRLGKKEEGYRHLDQSYKNFQKWCAIPNETALDMGNPWIFGGVKVIKNGWNIQLPDGTREYSNDMSSLFCDWRDHMYYGMTHWDGFAGVREEERFRQYLALAKALAEAETEEQ